MSQPKALSQFEIFPIVTQDSADIPLGAIVYFQTGIQGTPLGLLLSLTNTPSYYRALKTQYGIKRISL